jgi:hypothetical protein
MTDKEKLAELLDSWGVPHHENEPGHVTVGSAPNVVEYSDKVTGYGGFFTDFEFSESGEFLKIGTWE